MRTQIRRTLAKLQTPGCTTIIDSTGDGVGNSLLNAAGIGVGLSGSVYVAGSSSNNVFKITPGGTITQILDATGDGAGNVLAFPTDIAVRKGSDVVYVVGLSSDNAFRISKQGVIREIIDSNGGSGFKRLSRPTSIAVDGDGFAYVAGGQSNNVIKINPGGATQQIIDQNGNGTGARLDAPSGVAVDAGQNVFVTGRYSHNAFRVTRGLHITEIINSSGAGNGLILQFPPSVAVNRTGTAYVTNNTGAAYSISGLAYSSRRNASPNPSSYRGGGSVLGSTMSLTVDLTTTGHSSSVIIATDASASTILGTGGNVLIGGNQLFMLPLTPGPKAKFTAIVPNDMSLAGITIYTQAVHLFGVVPFALSNAVDFTIGF